MRFSAIRRVVSTGSTNDDMAQILGESEARGLTIAADFQTHGAGRKGRSWIAPAGSALLFTTALPDPIPAERLWLVPFWIALAVRAALNDSGVETQLQWPNDVLLRGRKAAGILCISRVVANEAWAACGVGINVIRPHDAAIVAEIDPAPAFLSDVRTLDRDELLAAILWRADLSYEMLGAAGAVSRAWEAAAGLPGARYRIALDGEPESFEATALRLGGTGELIVDVEGSERAIALADARVLR